MLNSMKIMNYLDYRPRYDIDKCVKSKSKKSSCEKCYEVCPHDAIEVYKKGIKINDNCNFCGICTAYCPSNAISDGGRKFCRDKNKMFAVCSIQANEEIKNESINVECLRSFNTKMLLNMYTKGIRTIYVNRGKCNDCKYSHNIEKELKLANEILKALNESSMRIEEMELDKLYEGLDSIEKAKSEKTVDRRNFFKQLAKEVVSSGYDFAPPIIKEEGLEELVRIIKKLETKATQHVALYDVNVDKSKCIECNACVKLCPEKVWKSTNEELTTKIYDCNGCGLCEDICPTKAIDLKINVRKTQLKVDKKEMKTCDTCEKEFTTKIKGKITCSKCIGKVVFRSRK